MAVQRVAVQAAPRGRNPFDTSGVERGADGIARYTGRPESLVHMLRASVERDPGAEAVVEVGGERLTFQQLWDRASRVAGGLRAAGLRQGDRAAIVLPNGIDWVLAFWGAQLAGLVTVPVNTRFTEPEVDYVVDELGGGVRLQARRATARRRAAGGRGLKARRPRRDLLHERHDRDSRRAR